ncbi:methylenetetrahydrofolate--tRNA-(uracil(54)-C(5))-methyltransferase (FADH(2)-oxidizing) TrmFO [Maridesulfovibrio ferrireducens]|uniref:methylenetetrahydrofolate--tRNA-(uracil(54)- C(5))-methyltransferase (FADH(2)-oxidizing) TrmFO n=1 Tax=Maridesulfovibrio ferrireducens TaxID=246191 RepID=UPI001A35166A|nr:methylenetetrahydrofolate--tRNA-(uracil(54)-C(5))-methyltransferase (FADH(2)-oxidizing) TrmFO [Maridesulfovibrio ferrireducens]MBI9110457.1 methylenetetrahydrofolate--tRNA-(uracil(54)-C(5))-methyltransferase (FADH(2)-oxidizing) TrmFO [Maridesulfovibrio ferrireducens]
MEKIAVIGGGLAGCECAMQLAKAEIPVVLFEMKPDRYSEAHHIPGLAELVCSNSLRSGDLSTAVGVLKKEMESLDSVVMKAAMQSRVPAGSAVAVDRDIFSNLVTEALEAEELITIVRKEITSLDDPELAEFSKIVVSAGPLASEALTESLIAKIGGGRLYFYDAIAPIVSKDSVNMDIAFFGSRYKPEDDDYLNCPMTEEQYAAFLAELKKGERVVPREFEKEIHFEGCLPIEEMADRGDQTLTFGPLKPVGLIDPRTEEMAYAVVQLRAENKEKTSFNLVGFQTKLKYPEQKRIFRMIPGLENVEFLRLGSIHRNTYVNAPDVLDENLALKADPRIHLAGQITGVEGYLESAACGLWVGLFLAQQAKGRTLSAPPAETSMGALLGHLREHKKNFQPSNVQFGLMPALNKRAPKRVRKELYAKRAMEMFENWFNENLGE